MKILILYFSGTGNTYFIANMIYINFKEDNYKIQLSSIENFLPENVKGYDILIFGFPIYACDMPLFLQEYVDRMSLPKSRGVMLFSTFGFYAGNSLRRTAKKFIDKGFIPLVSEEVKMPGSDGLAFMKKDSNFVNKVLSKNYLENPIIKNYVNKIYNFIDKNTDKLKQELNREDLVMSKLKARGVVLDSFVKMIYNPGERFIKNRFWADNKCIKCRLCEKICPANNIRVTNNEVIFSNQCYLCMRCIHQCPVESIQIGKWTVDKFRWQGPNNDYKPAKLLNKT
ncbi:EFR1 family ferrodoxin [Orenia marismortui]|uniref:EFR1 family ferrodoxin n=1 Tax=Orenia marismortui TaxID=46469 RepID=UPI000372B5E8|nr:EFR1 family ferrodoxin [Orenia marismortui]